ncbi:MAG: hypothetical protein FWF46_03635 [Oscillospiraceae bacterium]|nr:hypothetical protein [Oscillospiraceae bacterium]
MDKQLKSVFKDYVAIGNIAHCTVKEVNLYKKSNKLVVHLVSQNAVDPSELIDFETYLRRKFNSDVEVNVDNVGAHDCTRTTAQRNTAQRNTT